MHQYEYEVGAVHHDQVRMLEWAHLILTKWSASDDRAQRALDLINELASKDSARLFVLVTRAFQDIMFAGPGGNPKEAFFKAIELPQ